MRRTIAIVAVACCAANAAAQQWIDLDGLWGSAVAYDTRRGRAVFFGNEGGTWEFDGTTRLHRAALLPFARSNTAMAYDQARGHTLLFGGRARFPLSDTWLWDGSTWQQAFSAVTPPRRIDPALAYDSARNCVVLFGGQDGTAVFNDTWEHDGTQWTQRTPLTVPAVVSSPQLAFDSARNVTVLVVVGPASPGLLLHEWNGTDWLARTPASAPTQRNYYTLSHDPLRQRTVLCGGTVNGSEIWEWDGNAWQLMPAPAPLALLKPGMFFDPARGATVIVGLQAATWTWNGTTFASLWPARSPQPRSYHAVYHDTARNRSVLFGGGSSGNYLNDTWEWDGLRWTERPLAASPPPRQGAMACFDPVTASGLLLGGSSAGYLGDCWRFDGSNWTQLSGATPSARRDGAMAWDPVRNEAILFGGRTSTTLGDTWRWNGTAWSQVITATAPPARCEAGMAFDAVRGRMVLHGGLSTGPVPHWNDTWEWDGAQWRAIVTPQSPQGLVGVSMVHDPVAGRMVVAGMHFGAMTEVQVWEYDGVTWTLTSQGGGYSRLVWDGLRQRRLLFDGSTVRELSSSPAGVDLLGNGCGAPPPLLAARARPRTGEGLFGLELWTGASRPSLFVLGWSAGSTPLGNGCTLLVQQVTATFTISNAAGLAVLPIPLPANHALRGLVVYAQAGVLDPAAPGGRALSHALRLTVGD